MFSNKLLRFGQRTAASRAASGWRAATCAHRRVFGARQTCACPARSWRQSWLYPVHWRCGKLSRQKQELTIPQKRAHWRFGVLLGRISRPLYAGWLTIVWQRQNPDQVSRARDIISSGLSPRVLPLLLQPPSRPQLVDSVESSIELYRLLFNCI
jgi:hypothetical protein